MTAKVGYYWHLRRLMAERGLFATTELRPLLAERGVRLSREQVYRLVTGTPQRLNLVVLAALCDILECSPADLVEPHRDGGRAWPSPAEPAQAPPQPTRARVAPAGERRQP